MRFNVGAYRIEGMGAQLFEEVEGSHFAILGLPLLPLLDFLRDRGACCELMVILGLTGSIGMGKSTVAKMFADEGVPVFDADAAVHRLQGPDGALVAEIEAAFPGTTGPEGVEPHQRSPSACWPSPRRCSGSRRWSTRRWRASATALPRRPCRRAGGRARHPLAVREGRRATWSTRSRWSPPHAEMQRVRTLARPGMTPGEIPDASSRHQMPDAEKRARADFVIPTDCPLDETRASVRRILACLGDAADS